MTMRIPGTDQKANVIQLKPSLGEKYIAARDLRAQLAISGLKQAVRNKLKRRWDISRM